MRSAVIAATVRRIRIDGSWPGENTLPGASETLLLSHVVFALAIIAVVAAGRKMQVRH